MARQGTDTRWDEGVVILLVSIWLLGWLWPALARSEPPTADPGQQVVERMISLMRQAQGLQAEGKDAEAIPLIEQAVALGEQGLAPGALPLALALEMLIELEGVSHVLDLSEGSSKLIPINEEPNHQIVHLFRLGKANRTTH